MHALRDTHHTLSLMFYELKMVENHKYIRQSLLNKSNGISKSHNLIEFIEEVKSIYNIKILDAIKIERPIYKDCQIDIITDTKEDARKLNSNNQNQLNLKNIFQKTITKYVQLK